MHSAQDQMDIIIMIKRKAGPRSDVSKTLNLVFGGLMSMVLSRNCCNGQKIHFLLDEKRLLVDLCAKKCLFSGNCFKNNYIMAIQYFVWMLNNDCLKSHNKLSEIKQLLLEYDNVSPIWFQTIIPFLEWYWGAHCKPSHPSACII